MNFGIAICLMLLAGKFFPARYQFIHPAMASTSFIDLVNSKGTTVPATIQLDPGDYSIDGDFAIPKNITLHFMEGAVITIPGGTTFSINGNIDDNTFYIFNDQNADLAKGVKFNGGTFSVIRPEWWGAKGDDNSNSAGQNSNAIEKAANALKNTETVFFSTGKYYISRTILLPQGVSLAGQGDTHNYDNTSVIRLKDNANTSMVATSESGVSTYHRGGDIKNIRFHGGSQSATVNGIEFSNIIINAMRIENCGFTNFNGYAVYTRVAGRTMIENNWVSDSQNGMNLQNYDGWIRNNTINFTGDYGFRLIGFDTPFQGNKVSGGTSGKTCLGFDSGSAFASFIGNELKNCDYGIADTPTGALSAKILKNTISNNRKDGIYIQRYLSGAQICENTITGNGRYGINIPAAGGVDSKISNNDLSGNASGPILILSRSSWGAPHAQKEVALVEDNAGVDLGVGTNYPNLSLTDPSTLAPRVTSSKRWKTNNTSPLTITSFSFAPRGKDIYVNFGDNNTTLKFSNGSYGPERLINGSFDTASNWTLSDGWTFDSADHSMHHTAGTGWGDKSGVLEQSLNPITIGEYYEIKFTIRDYQSGIITPNIGYGDAGEEFGVQGNGTHIVVMRVRDTNSRVFRLLPIYDFAGTIDNVSVRKVDTTLRGFEGGDKRFSSGDEVHCTKGPDAYWYCDDAKISYNELSSADLNQDSKIDQADLEILKTDFLKLTASLTNPKSDINQDGQATIKDVGILMSGWKP